MSGTSSKVKQWKACETRNENDNQRFRRRRKEAMPRTSPLRAIRSMYWNNLSYCLRCLGSTWMGGRCSTNVRRFFFRRATARFVAFDNVEPLQLAMACACVVMNTSSASFPFVKEEIVELAKVIPQQYIEGQLVGLACTQVKASSKSSS